MRDDLNMLAQSIAEGSFHFGAQLIETDRRDQGGNRIRQLGIPHVELELLVEIGFD